MVGPLPAISPKRPLLVPKTGTPAASKVPGPPTTPKVLFAPKKASLEALKASFSPTKTPPPPKKAPLIMPKLGVKKSVAADVSVVKPPAPLSKQVSDVNAIGARQSNAVQDNNHGLKAPSLEKLRSSTQLFPDQKSLKTMLSSALVPSIDVDQRDGSNEVPIERSLTPKVASTPAVIAKVKSRSSEASINAVNPVMKSSVPSGAKASPPVDDVRDVTTSAKNVITSMDVDTPGTVGSTPWLDIERRINEIRALASANAPEESARSPRRKATDGASLYGS